MITVGAFYGASRVSMRGMSFSSMFPSDIEVKRTMKVVEDNFGGSESVNIVVHLDPEQTGYNSIMDIRDPEVLRFVDILSKKSRDVENVLQVTSIADILRNENNGILPNSKREILSLLKASQRSRSYVSEDYSTTLVKIRLGNIEGQEEVLVSDLEEIIAQTTPPSGVKAEISGSPVIYVLFKESTGPDMSRTTMYSFIGILVVAILLFASIKHGIIPIISVAIGLLWAFGLMGVLGIRISSNMAGFGSMVMGIGIDFAIQVVNRFRLEKEGLFSDNQKKKPEEALAKALSNTFIPMSTTTLAALIGFRAMSLGKLTIMGDLGTVMSLGVLACMGTALTLVPSLLIISEKFEKVV
jgi:hypothetical protein